MAGQVCGICGETVTGNMQVHLRSKCRGDYSKIVLLHRNTCVWLVGVKLRGGGHVGLDMGDILNSNHAPKVGIT